MLHGRRGAVERSSRKTPTVKQNAVHQCLFSPLHTWHVTDIHSDKDRSDLFSEGFPVPFGIIAGPRAALPAGLHTVAGEEREVCDRECLEFSSPP